MYRWKVREESRVGVYSVGDDGRGWQSVRTEGLVCDGRGTSWDLSGTAVWFFACCFLIMDTPL